MSRANQGPRAARRFRDAGAGVSSVVSAVLLFALFTTAFTLWTFNTLPSWVADREEAHAHSAQEGLAASKAALEALSAADDAGPSTVAFRLGPDPVALLQRVPARGDLSVDDGIRFQAGFTNEAILLVDDAAAGTPDDDIAGDVLADVNTLKALLVRLTTTVVGPNDESWVQAVAQDGDGDTVTATVVHTGQNAASAGCVSAELRIEVTSDLGTRDQILSCGVDDSLPNYIVNLLDPIYAFSAGVDRLDVPYTVTLTDGSSGGTSTGTYTAAWLDSDGFLKGAGSGQATDLDIDETGDRIVQATAYQQYEQQEVSWELGGVALAQGDGAALDVGPAFALGVDGTTGFLQWTVATLDGDGGANGLGQATVEVRHVQTTDVLLRADGATFTLTTPAAAAWRSFLEDQVLLAGASDAAVGGTGSTATLTLALGTVTEWRIQVRLVDAQVTVS